MNKRTLTVGFAVFAMFFGAGNMVLPLYIMQKWPNTWLPAFIGFCITAVLVTMLGLLASVLVQGNIKKFFAPLGFLGGIALQTILIAIEGPFGVVPRSLIVAFGGIKNLLPDLSPHIFYSLSCIAVYFCSLNRQRIVKFIGNVVTPIMLITLILVIGHSYIEFGTDNITLEFSGNDAFLSGLFEGYLTYDLPGAIYFTSIAMVYLTAISSDKKDIIRNGLKASLISAILLISVYSMFIYLGLSHNELLQNTPPEQILPTIIKSSLGSGFSIIFAIFIFLACVSTAIAAVTIWTDFIYYYFPKLNYRRILGFSLAISYGVCLLDFTRLMGLLGPVLNWVYPVLIVLTVYNIIIHLKKINKPENSEEVASN